jgi:hypothetical protein
VLVAVPRSLKTQATFTIKQGTVFRHSAAPYFFVEQGKLTYALTKGSPNWLSIHPQTGVVWGKAPMVYTAKNYNVTVVGSNTIGSAEWVFFLTVTRDNFNHEVDAVIQRYQEQKNRQRLEAYYTPELLEYIFAFFEQHEPKQREEFFKLLHEKAKEFGIEVSDKPIYKDFAKVAKAINPDVQSLLVAELGTNSPLPHAQVSPHDLQNLFRQGSQPTGALAGPVFNYFGAPTQQVLSLAIKTIFNASILAVMERQQVKQQKSANVIQSVPTIEPSLPKTQPS